MKIKSAKLYRAKHIFSALWLFSSGTRKILVPVDII